MNAFTMLNQEFTRCLVAEWNDEASIRQQEQETNAPYVGIVTRFASWINRRMTPSPTDGHVTFHRKNAQV